MTCCIVYDANMEYSNGGKKIARKQNQENVINL